MRCGMTESTRFSHIHEGIVLSDEDRWGTRERERERIYVHYRRGDLSQTQVKADTRAEPHWRLSRPQPGLPTVISAQAKNFMVDARGSGSEVAGAVLVVVVQ